MINDDIKEILDYLDYGVNNLSISKPPFKIGYEDIKKLLDYITNLQQELETRQYDINNLTYQLAKEKEEKEDYKSRCEKAIEYINENWGHWCSDHCTHATETINILNGRSDE